MSKPRTPEEVCVEYAIANAEVRAQSKIMRDNPCEIMSSIEAETAAAVQSRPSIAGIYKHPSERTEDCIALHWQVDTGPAPNFVETEHLAFEDMCAPCQARYEAIMQRKEARRRLGAAKRSVEAVGKRLNAEASRG